MNTANHFENFDMYPALQALRPYAMAISLVTLIVSIIYTVFFNIGQTNSTDFITLLGVDIYYSQWLLAITGVMQDSSEVLLFVFGFWILGSRGRKPLPVWLLAVTAVCLSITLILWSIASTWGGNNAMIDASVAASQHEKQKVQLIQQTIQTNQAAVESMNRNAAAIRIQAAEYGEKYISRSIDKIKDAQGISEQAASLAQNSLQALEKLEQVDQEKLAQSNSALAAFERIGKFTGHDANTIGTTFLLTRATQLELIGIITGLFCIFVPAPARRPGLWARFKEKFVAGAEQVADEVANRAGRGVAEIATASPPGSRITDALNRSNPSPFPDSPKPPQPSSNAGSNALAGGSGTPANPPDNSDFALLRKYVSNAKFDAAFIGVATGQTKCSQKQAMKKHGLGGDMASYFMIILEAWDIASAPDQASKQRTLIRPLSEAQARAELADIKTEILGKGA